MHTSKGFTARTVLMRPSNSDRPVCFCLRMRKSPTWGRSLRTCLQKYNQAEWVTCIFHHSPKSGTHRERVGETRSHPHLQMEFVEFFSWHKTFRCVPQVVRFCRLLYPCNLWNLEKNAWTCTRSRKAQDKGSSKGYRKEMENCDWRCGMFLPSPVLFLRCLITVGRCK